MSDGTPPYGPPPYGTPPPPPPPYGPGPKPDNNLVWAILSTVLCCLPVGVASIVFAAQVDSKWAAGDYAGAREASEKARRFAILSAALAAAGFVLLLVLTLFGTIASRETTV